MAGEVVEFAKGDDGPVFGLAGAHMYVGAARGEG